MELRSPASSDEARRWLAASAPTIPTPANRQLHSEGSLERTFASGRRGPDTVWAAFDGERLLGVVAGRDFGDERLIDMLALGDDDAVARDLIAAATGWSAAATSAEASFGGPAQAPLDDPAVARLHRLLADAGWRLLVTRRHYELPAAGMTARDPRIPLERAAAGDEPRLAALLERVLPGSLDVRDRRSVAEHGLEVAASRLAHELLDADPIDCIRFAPDDAGMISWLATPSGTGFVLQVAVAEDARGRGLGRALVAAATAALLAEGVHTLVADTDDANVPMQRAFAAEGWHPTESRIDLQLP